MAKTENQNEVETKSVASAAEQAAVDAERVRILAELEALPLGAVGPGNPLCAAVEALKASLKASLA